MYLIRLPNFSVFCVFCEFRGILRIYLNFAAPPPREISEALAFVDFLYHVETDNVSFLWKNSSCKAKSVPYGTTNGQRFWGLMLQSLNVINFWPGSSKKPGQHPWLKSLRPGRPGFFDQACPESSALKVTRPGRPSFGGQRCQESLAAAMLAGLYQAAFSW